MNLIALRVGWKEIEYRKMKGVNMWLIQNKLVCE